MTRKKGVRIIKFHPKSSAKRRKEIREAIKRVREKRKLKIQGGKE